MSRLSKSLRGGALLGLALLVSPQAFCDEALRKQVHKTYKHQSYMLLEDARGARLFLFGDGVQVSDVADEPVDSVKLALEKARSPDARARVRGLTELAGSDSHEALDVALQLLTDPSRAVRDEAQHTILDHPHGADMVAALGLIDDDMEE